MGKEGNICGIVLFKIEVNFDLILDRVWVFT